MTKDELIDLVKPLEWSMNRYRRIRTGDHVCPILAAFALTFPDERLPGGNAQWDLAAKRLGLPFPVAQSLVKDADGGAPWLQKALGLAAS